MPHGSTPTVDTLTLTGALLTIDAISGLVAPVYDIRVDWENAGDFSGDHDDVTEDVRGGFSCERGRDQIRELAPPMAGRFDAKLNNTSRKYSIHNSSSDLFGNLKPGREVRARGAWPFSTDVHGLFRGRITDLPQNPLPGERSVRIPALGGLGDLVGKSVSTALYSDITTDEAIGHLLDAADWPAGRRSLDTGQTTLEWWWLNDEDAMSALVDLLNTEGLPAAIYEDGDGDIVFESRHYRLLTSRSTESQATFYDYGNEPHYLTPYHFEPGLQDVFNAAEVTRIARSEQATEVVWELGEALTLSADEQRVLVATAVDPFKDAITPVEDTDFTVTSGSVSSVSLDRNSGQNAEITMTAGSDGATITDLQLRANPVEVDSTRIIRNTVDASDSIADYGRRPWPGTVRGEVAASFAQDLVNAIVGRNSEPRAQIEITVPNGTDEQTDEIFTREISDRITLVEQQTGFNGDVFIEQRRDEVQEQGFVHMMSLGCEEDIGFEAAIWGASHAKWTETIWGY